MLKQVKTWFRLVPELRNLIIGDMIDRVRNISQFHDNWIDSGTILFTIL